MVEPYNSSSALNGCLNDVQLVDRIKSANVLLVGAGGIGCEVVKNLILTGFNNITIVDLDTIDISNLNRQFLFNKAHVSQSKALIAAKVAQLRFGHPREEINITPLHTSIQSQDYDVDFFKSFTLVINALDNRAARSHVNRMCLSAKVPLIESGSEGYLGQVYMISKNETACYECGGPKQDQKTYASCTIRNTPSLPIHCIVWGKHLFAQLFGEEDPDNDVSPDMNDPELEKKADDDQTEKRERPPSTRDWAQKNSYDPKLLFDKLFRADIEYLIKMDKLWENRTKPIPLNLENLENLVCKPSSSTVITDNGASSGMELKEQRLWSLAECYTMFAESVLELKKQLEKDEFLVWDKDDISSLNFVTAVSNLRSYCFHIDRKSKFDVKSMAGNIIPAISSTNSIVGGLICLQAISLLRKLGADLNLKPETEESKESSILGGAGRHIILKKVSLNSRSLISSYELEKQNPNCLVCCTGRIPEIEVSLNLKETTMYELVEHLIISKLNFVCPDVQLDGLPTVLWSKEDLDEQTPEEKEISKKRLMINFPSIRDKVRLKVYDLLQNQTIIVTVRDEPIDKNENDGLFYKLKIISEGDLDSKKDEDDQNPIENGRNEQQLNGGEVSDTNGEAAKQVVEDEEDLIEVLDDEDNDVAIDLSTGDTDVSLTESRKRKVITPTPEITSPKKAKM